jgi:hypothetical protein
MLSDDTMPRRYVTSSYTVVVVLEPFLLLLLLLLLLLMLMLLLGDVTPDIVVGSRISRIHAVCLSMQNHRE